jgi:hypothetical protein
LQVPDRLGVLQVAEGVAGVGDLHVLVAVVDELHEEAVGRTALVHLSGRVEEAGAIAEGGGRFGPSADPRPHLGDRRVELRRRLDVGHERHVVGRGGLRQQLLEVARIDLRQPLLEDARGVVLRLLHVRLVERVDSEHPARHGGGELREEEDSTEVCGAVHGERDGRVTGTR